jgi:hypothetical protein
MNASSKKQALTAILALLAIVAAGLIVRREVYAFDPDRQWDQARAARAAGHHSPPNTKPSPAKDVPAGPPARKPGADATGGKPAHNAPADKPHEK